MKTVVSVNEISEFEIKPKAELARWKSSVTEEIHTRWAGKKDWVKVNCPVCSKNETIPAFDKSAFAYVECKNCKTLYAEERPSEKELNWWYKESASTRFWKQELLQLSAASRDEKIIEPRANWIMDGLSEYLPGQLFTGIHYTDISFFGKALD
jgi:ribosomal protein S27E